MARAAHKDGLATGDAKNADILNYPKPPMSKVNIKRAVENIRASTTVYTPIVEVVVNAIQAIESTGRLDGQIAVRIHRATQLLTENGLAEVQSFDIEDNGIGFTDENCLSFDTLFSDFKINEGGKGFGRFTCLKYFDNVHVDSTYNGKNGYKRRKFSMGKANVIIVNEKITDSVEETTGTVVHLSKLKDGKSLDKKLGTIARNLAEKLLPNFLVEGYVCPEIVLSERDGSDSIRLNDWFSNELSGVIKEIITEDGNFSLNGINDDEAFIVRVFKLYYPKNQKAR